jgi:hypothetical protein
MRGELMYRFPLILSLLLATISAYTLSPSGPSDPQGVLLYYSAHGPIPEFTLAMSESTSTGRIDSIILTKNGCEIVVPQRYYEDLAMPYLAEACMHLDLQVDGTLSVEIRFGVFLPSENGGLMCQTAILDVENDAVTRRRFMMQANGSLWYEEW